jgi:hypothetical protein
MARPRIKQFADDMGISYNEAKRLIAEGRSRRDGGSMALERNMNKMKGYEKGGMPKPPPRKPDDIEMLDPDHPANTEGRGARAFTEEELRQIERDERMMGTGRYRDDEKESKGRNPRKIVKAATGMYRTGMACRGAGKAIKGTKFSGTF